MSHFTVLVPAKNEEELEQKLLPYHEYECTGIEEYTEFVPADMEEAETKYKEVKDEYDYPSFDEFMDDWYGYRQNDEGIWGRKTNPNAKWDWWVIGGRWSNMLKNKTEDAMVNIAKKKDIDWGYEDIRNKVLAAEKWDKWHTVKAPTVEQKLAILNGGENGLMFWSKDDIEKLNTLTKEEYVNLHVGQALTFAFIDLEGNWNEKGKMGWWASVTDEQDDYPEKFWKFIKSMPDDQVVYIVDCHI